VSSGQDPDAASQEYHRNVTAMATPGVRRSRVAPACDAARHSRCAGATSTWMPGESPSDGACGVVEDKVKGERLIGGATKTGQSRVVDLEAGRVAALRAYRAVCGSLALDLVRDSALVLGNLGSHRHPERVARRFAAHVLQARMVLGEEPLPVIRLHDLRHTHATLLLAAGEPVNVVSEPRSRQRDHHPDRLPARAPRHGATGSRPVRRAARRLTRFA
jgi:hypothetical protein